MNERITSKTKPQKLQIVQHFFGFQLARAAPVLLLRATGVSSTSHSSREELPALRVITFREGRILPLQESLLSIGNTPALRVITLHW